MFEIYTFPKSTLISLQNLSVYRQENKKYDPHHENVGRNIIKYCREDKCEKNNVDNFGKKSHNEQLDLTKRESTSKSYNYEEKNSKKLKKKTRDYTINESRKSHDKIKETECSHKIDKRNR